MAEIQYRPGRRTGKKPLIKKLGAVSVGMEQTPIVTSKGIELVESVSTGHPDNPSGPPFFRVRTFATGEKGPAFAHDYYFASAYHENGITYAFGTCKNDDRALTMYQGDDTSQWHDPRGGDTIRMFWSRDHINWQHKDIITIPHRRLWNTSVCKGKDRYIMAIEESGRPGYDGAAVGQSFTSFFAESADLQSWTMMPDDKAYTRERYNACPAIRWHDGYYYMICLEALPCVRYAPYIYRTADFCDWEPAVHNPVMMWDDDDRIPKNGVVFDAKTTDILENALNINCSDVDLCEYEGKTHIFYSNGDQMTYSFLCEAVYDGPLGDFLESYFK